VVVACVNCPDCPPCTDREQGKTSQSSAEGETEDSVLAQTDAGVTSAKQGGEPKAVTSYELHGRAGFDKVNIFSEPDMESPRLGYMRMGQRTMLGDPEYSTENCPKGWFKLPEGGFVCQGRGMLVGTKPRFIRRVPPKPLVDSLDPYRHGFIRSDWTPSYKRIPAIEEVWAPPSREILDVVVPDGGEIPTEIIQHDENEADGGVDYNKYTKRKYRAVRMLLSRGFWVSVGARRFDQSTRKYFYETIKGDFIPGENVHLIKPPAFHGYEVLGDSPLPAVIVRNRHASFFTQRRGQFRGIGPVDRLAVYRVYEEAEARGAKFYKIESDRWLKSTQVEYFELSELPKDIGDQEKWIRVDLSRQILEAYEGTMPVFVTLVSTGLPESEETVTPTGEFHVKFKHLSDNMAGTVGDDEVYSVEDVPWVQYIHRNIAFHASFWHSSYGRPKSHGCINLAPADARWLFNWTEPRLLPKWHGVSSTDKSPGTRVIIQGKTPE
jgi:L,D-transpeptidase-like protein